MTLLLLLLIVDSYLYYLICLLNVVLMLLSNSALNKHLMKHLMDYWKMKLQMMVVVAAVDSLSFEKLLAGVEVALVGVVNLGT